MSQITISTIASGIWEDEFDSDTGIMISSIESSLESNLGRMNLLLHTNFCVSSGEFYPEVGNEEATILSQIYLERYYTKEARKVLRGITSSSSDMDWITLKEGDTSITRANRSEVSKTYFNNATSIADNLNDLVTKYISYQASPRQVAGDDAPTE